MKKLIFTIIGVVGLTAGSWGQTVLESFNISGLPDMKNAANTETNSPNGPYSFSHYKTNYFGPFYAVEAVYTNAHGWHVYTPNKTPEGNWDSSYYDINATGTFFYPPDYASNGNYPALIIGNGLFLDNILTNTSLAFEVTTPWSGYDVAQARFSQSGGGASGAVISSVSPQVTQTVDGLILQEGEFYPLDSQPQQ